MSTNDNPRREMIESRRHPVAYAAPELAREKAGSRAGAAATDLTAYTVIFFVLGILGIALAPVSAWYQGIPDAAIMPILWITIPSFLLAFLLATAGTVASVIAINYSMSQRGRAGICAVIDAATIIIILLALLVYVSL